MSNTFMQSLNINVSDVGARKNFATITTAIATAYAIAVPAVKIDGETPYTYFDNVHEENAKKILCYLNETCVISIKDALELTRKLWVQRYNLVHNPTSIGPVALVASVTGQDELSLGNEFLAYCQSVKVASKEILKEAQLMVDKAESEYAKLKQESIVETIVTETAVA